MNVRFHCTARLARAVKRSRHHVARECERERVKTVIRSSPEYGVVIPRHAPLRKMRVHVQALACGKSGGYRMIYRVALIDEVKFVVLLELYYKGDREDLDAAEYSRLAAEAESVLDRPLSFIWE